MALLESAGISTAKYYLKLIWDRQCNNQLSLGVGQIQVGKWLNVKATKGLRRSSFLMSLLYLTSQMEIPCILFGLVLSMNSLKYIKSWKCSPQICFVKLLVGEVTLPLLPCHFQVECSWPSLYPTLHILGKSGSLVYAVKWMQLCSPIIGIMWNVENITENAHSDDYTHTHTHVRTHTHL